jgi:unsaturated rhamnogalacturonyl hydrolase
MVIRYLTCITIASLFLTCQSKQEKTASDFNNPDSLVHLVVNHFYEKNNVFRNEKDVWGNYTLDLTFEGMLAYDQACDSDIFLPQVVEIMQKRNLSPEDTVSYKSQPFGCLTFALYESTGNEAYLAPFTYSTNKKRTEADFSPEGAILLESKGKKGWLIDYMQEYASRLAKAGFVTGDTAYFREAVKQFELYHQTIRHPENGLYSQGKGWLDKPGALSPGAWSRGQGWILRGMVSTCKYLPENSAYRKRLEPIIREFVDTLIQYQDKQGMWHQMVHLPFKDSYPETSGTAFIAYYLTVALDLGIISGEKYFKVLRKAYRGLQKQISPEGAVLNACEGPGPIYSIEKYYKTKAPPDEPHGTATMIYGLAGMKIFERLSEKKD